MLARLHDHLTRLLAPIIPHTAEESWDYRPADAREAVERPPGGVPRARPRSGTTTSRDARWDELLKLREQVLDRARGSEEEQADRQRQEAKVRIATSRPEHWLPDRELLATLCIVSEVEIVADPAATGRDRSRPSARPTPSASAAGTIGPPSARAPSIRPSASGACGCSRNEDSGWAKMTCDIISG